MINNDVLRSVRYMLNISEFQLVDIVKLGGGDVSQAEMNAFIKKEDEPGFIECRQNVMAHFLNGLIYLKRGKDDSRPPLQTDLPTNNVVLKKIRVAFELKDDDILKLINDVGFQISKGELSAFFRKEGHPNFRQCGDQFLRYFLKGLSEKLRPQPKIQ
jgi:uncharacterized protein YehS (DUF1456 family)